MKMLAAVVVLFLVVGVSDGIILTKCGLKKQLETGLNLQMPNSTELLAQIVCHVQQASGFNTNTIKKIAEPKENKTSPAPHSGKHPKGRKAKGDSSGDKSTEDKKEVWTLYGLFQLSDHVVCSSTKTRELNICGLSCSKLIDDNISDDIACVQTLINALTAQIPDTNAVRHIQEMVSLIRQPECLNTKADSYFFDC